MGGCGLDSSGSGQGPVASSYDVFTLRKEVGRINETKYNNNAQYSVTPSYLKWQCF
jgi:hypothetical protein